MAKNIDPQLKVISEYLKLKQNENFVIPEYQRGYSWSITQCDKLWQDIDTFIQSGATDPYFFGTIIVDCSETNKFSLIDGQQRTTTFLLLLKALLIRLNQVIDVMPRDEENEGLLEALKGSRKKIMAILYKAEDEDIPSMLKDPSKTQNILILENKSINELYLNEIKKIVEAVDFKSAEENVYKIPRRQKDNKYTHHFRNFKFFYEKLSDLNESNLNKFAKILLNECQVIEIRSWQIEQAITMFNSLNSTGLPLSDADIISAQLYSNAGENKAEFNKKWEYVNKLANDLNHRKIGDIDSILQQFMYINRAIGKDYYKNDGKKEIIDVSTPGLRRYYTDIQKDLLKQPFDLCGNFIKIAEIWDKIKDFPLVKLLLKFNENAKIFLISYLYRFNLEEITENSVTEICENLLKLFAILELSDSGYSSAKFKTFLFGENIKLVNKNITIEEISNDFREHIHKNWEPTEIEETIFEYEKNILVFLNEYIYAKEKGVLFDFTENVNIEHIMPSSGKNITTIQQDAEISDKEEFLIFVNKLGNKILLEEDINKSISNEWFKTKKQNTIASKTGYKNSQYGIARALTNYPNLLWTKQDIEVATKKASGRISNFIFNQKNIQ